MSTAPNYQRPPLRWITRRARCLQNAFGINRREALRFAVIDYAWFQGMRGLTVVQGGRSHG